jgi:hypothetical protein
MLGFVEGEFCLSEVLEVPEVIRCVLLCMLVAVEGEFNFEDLKFPLWQFSRCSLLFGMLFCILEAIESELCLLEVMRCVLLCMLEAVEGGLCLLEVLEVPEVMYCVPLCMLKAVEGRLRFGVWEFPWWRFSRYSPPSWGVCEVEAKGLLRVRGVEAKGLMRVREVEMKSSLAAKGLACDREVEMKGSLMAESSLPLLPQLECFQVRFSSRS